MRITQAIEPPAVQAKPAKRAKPAKPANPAKRAVNLSLNALTLERARGLGMNLSSVVDELLVKEVDRQYWARWNEENKPAIEHYNARIASEGLPLARYRSFMKGG